MADIITEKELMIATGYQKRALLEKCLRSQKIRFHIGKGGQLWTTSDAINISLGIMAENKPSEEINF
jgi:hypothetical protein